VSFYIGKSKRNATHTTIFISSFSKPRKMRPALPINTEFGRSISVPADRFVHKTTPPLSYNTTCNTPTTPELE